MLVTRYLRAVRHMRRYLLWLILFGAVFSLILGFVNIPLPTFLIRGYYWVKPENGVNCHYYKPSHEDSLPDISDHVPKKGKSIFFHESSCNSILKGKITINARQACAVESAARMNPDYEVNLLFASPGRIHFEGTSSDRMIQALTQYSNVKLFHVDMERYFKYSPVENLWNQEKMRWSRFALSHTSDVLRYLTLWKYGGIYLDLDVIVIKSLKDLAADFSGIESPRAVAAGAMGFSSTGPGHELATECLEDLKNNFNGNNWGWNGPGTITRLLKKICGVQSVEEMIDNNCKGFKVYPPYKFYAIPYWDWWWFFDSDRLDDVKRLTINSSLIHVWNGFSSATKIALNASNTPYLEFAKQYCPNILRECTHYF